MVLFKLYNPAHFFPKIIFLRTGNTIHNIYNIPYMYLTKFVKCEASWLDDIQIHLRPAVRSPNIEFGFLDEPNACMLITKQCVSVCNDLAKIIL